MPEITADPKEVEEIVTFLLTALDEYLKQTPKSSVSVFMAVNNLHVLMTKDIARQWKSATPEQHTMRMADLTFRRSIRELRLPGRIKFYNA